MATPSSEETLYATAGAAALHVEEANLRVVVATHNAEVWSGRAVHLQTWIQKTAVFPDARRINSSSIHQLALAKKTLDGDAAERSQQPDLCAG